VQQNFGVKHSQTITFTSTAPGAASVGGATYTPAATATSALAVTITVDASSAGICSINGGGVVSFQSPGSCVLDANQTGNTGFYAAPQVQQSFTVSKGNQTITFTSTAPGAATVGGATYTPAATASSGLAVTITIDASSTGCSINGGGVVSFQSAGTCIVDANQAGNGNYNGAPQMQQNFTVNKNNQTITFTSTAPGAASVGGATYTPAATASSGLAVTITIDASSTGICSINGGGVVSFQAAGSCVLDANQTGNGTYNAAPQVQQTFTVGKGNQTITFTSTAPGAASVGGATYTAAATASSGLTVTFTSGSTTVCTSGGTNGSVFTFVGNGTCIVDANQAGNGNYNGAPQVQQNFGVKHSQTITFTSTAPGAASVGGATYTPAATATSALAVTITVDASSTGCSINGGGVVSFTSAGSCVLDANQAGNTGFYAAPQVQQSFAVTGLTITSAQSSGGTGTNPSMTLSGVGAAGATRVSVTICAVNNFPCSNRNTEATVTTGTNPANPWTTNAAAGALDYSTTYYAQATQGTQTSAVFTFATPTQTAPTAVALANGGTTRTIDTNDTATVTFSGPVNATSLCSTWNNTGTQTLSATITFTSAGTFNNPNDTFAAASGTCTTNFGTIFTGSNYVSGTVTFTNSTITWNPSTDLLTFKLGTIGQGSTNRNTTVAVGTPGYTASANVTDTSGLPVSTTNFTSGTTSGF
jgi:hypothetical protein